MNKQTDNVEVLRKRMHTIRSYTIYLNLIHRCGVIFVPAYGWVAE